ncbi:MAG: class I SAM-dependent methyltransferase [Pseudomonadota bacterium]
MNAPTDRYVPALAYDWLTPAYDTVVRLTTRESTFKSALLDQANLRVGQQVLDLACGTATLTIAAKQCQPGIEITGMDGDPAILARARTKAARAGVSIHFDPALSCATPYANGQFDRVLCSLFFHHLSTENKRRTFSEIARVLKPSGELHVADWGKAQNPLMRLAFCGIQLLDGFDNTADNVNGQLPALMRDAGFSGVSETRRFPTMWGTLSLYRAIRPD